MFYNIINKIKKNNKNKFIVTYVKKNEMFLLKKLLKLNLIKYIFKYKNKYVIILNLLKNNKLILNIKNMYKISNLKIINYNTIKKINKKKFLILISSSKNILDNFESIKKKTGGIILVAI